MPRTPQAPATDGVLIVDKPRGKTSHDIVEAVRRLVGFRRIGHLGTLDPLATGVLVLALGRATRLARFYAGRRKRYTCAIRFGFATDSYDAEGEPLGPDSSPDLEPNQIAALAHEFAGRILQTPPAFSAKKIHGRPAHELARKNKPVELAPVEVDVYEFRLTSIERSTARFTVECGAGTYIRSLAHDLGNRHGAGAHLSEISRVAVGEFTSEHAIPLAELAEDAQAGRIASRIIPLESLLPELPQTSVLPIVEKRVRHGAKFNVSLAQIKPGFAVAAQTTPQEIDSADWKPARLRVFSNVGKLIAIAEPIVPRIYRPLVVLETTA
jgi:tRNA pseudouridine55 synthase